MNTRVTGSVSGRVAAPRVRCPCRTILAAGAALLLCLGAGSVVTDTMPACAIGWRPALPASPGPKAWGYDVEVDVDATLIVRAPGGRIVAVLHRGERRAWTCPGGPQEPRLSS